MPLDINLFRTEYGGSLDLLRESQRKRGADPNTVDKVVDLDKQWRQVSFMVDEKNKELNALKKEIGSCMKTKQDASSLLDRKKHLETDQINLVNQKKQLEESVSDAISQIGNLVHSSVIDHMDESHNQVIRTWNKDDFPVTKNASRSHHEVLAKLSGYDAERGVKVAGHRGYFLTGVGVDLVLALVQYGLNFLKAKGYKKIMTPYFMNKSVMAKTAQLSQFDEELYKVSTGCDVDDKYLIATSEQPISAFHANEWLDAKSLPIMYAGFSSCFRKEAGAHGKDTWGVFRVHQFEKVEQFILCKPEDSWAMLEQMISTSEAFYQSLGLSYRVISIVSGALNSAAAKKYDLEAWFPFQGEYKELVSCSNCTDYQARSLEIRLGVKKDREKQYVHLLNGTLCAAERTLCCILENWQTENGLQVPPPLVPFVGQAFIPYTDVNEEVQASISGQLNTKLKL